MIEGISIVSKAKSWKIYRSFLEIHFNGPSRTFGNKFILIDNVNFNVKEEKKIENGKQKLVIYASEYFSTNKSSE